MLLAEFVGPPDERVMGAGTIVIEAMSPGILYPKITVIGCGLIGGSVIRAAREHGVVGEVTVADASEAHRARVVELGIADHVTGDIAEAVKDADLVVIATPVLSIPETSPPWPRHEARRHPDRRRLDQGQCRRGLPRPGPVEGLRHPRPPDRRHRAVGARRRLRRAVREPLDHPDPAESDDEAYAAAVAKLESPSGARSACPGRTDGPKSTTTWCWPSSATCPT
jgi:cyclohexadieny/prephenate dehydrogenase